MRMYQIVLSLCLVPSLLLGHERANVQASSVCQQRSEQVVKKRMLSDLEFIRQTFDVKYAPAEWKKKHLGLDVDAIFLRAQQTVRKAQNLTTKQFQCLVREAFSQISDYHVGVHFYSTETASLPFSVKSAVDSCGRRRYFVMSLEEGVRCPLMPGDEIVEWDGVPIDHVVQCLVQEMGRNKNFKETDQALAEFMLTGRSGSLGHQVPSGALTLGVIKKASSEIEPVVLRWSYTAERIKDFAQLSRPVQGPQMLGSMGRAAKKRDVWPQKLMVMAHWDRQRCESPYDMGNREGYLPSLGHRMWSTTQGGCFDAYIFQTPSRHSVGYVRIPHYMADEEEVSEFCDLMKYFELHTDMLVIDQLNNPGGSIFYLYGLLSTLTKTPLYVPKHHITLTQEEIHMATTLLSQLVDVTSLDDARAVLGETLGGYPISMDMVEKFREFNSALIAEWNAGKIYTDPLSFFGVDRIDPHPKGSYQKPILVLINELDFSGGDFFPAMLQDSGRAVLLGTRTAGAGGYVLGTSYPNHSGIAAFMMTGSLAERANEDPLEDLGVHPDIDVALTSDDLLYDYCDYVHTVLEVVEQMIQNGDHTVIGPVL